MIFAWVLLTLLETSDVKNEVLAFFGTSPDNSGLFFAGCFFLVNSIICGLDISQIKKAGYNPPCIGWILFLVPVYLWKRATVLKTNRIVFFLVMLSLVLPFKDEILGEFNNIYRLREIETLKAKRFELFSDEPLDLYLNKIARNIEYNAYSFNGKDYISVRVVDFKTATRQKNINFTYETRGDLICFEVSDIDSSENKGKTWITLDQITAIALLKNKALFKYSNAELNENYSEIMMDFRRNF